MRFNNHTSYLWWQISHIILPCCTILCSGLWWQSVSEICFKASYVGDLCWSMMTDCLLARGWVGGVGVDSISVSVFVWFLLSLTNTETAAVTPCERVRNLWWASAQWKVLESGGFWWLSCPTHMKSLLSGLLGSHLHHRGVGRGFSVTFSYTSCPNFGKSVFLQFWRKLDLFWEPEFIFLSPLSSVQSSTNTSIDSL